MNCITQAPCSCFMLAALAIVGLTSQAMTSERTVAPLPPQESFTDDDRPDSHWDGTYGWQKPWGYSRESNATRQYPLVVFGPWNEANNYFSETIRKQFPAFYMSYDQASDDAGSALSDRIDARIRDQGFRIDLNRIYLTGFSMGGSGSYKTLRGMISKGKCIAGLIRIAGQSESVLPEEAVNRIAISMHIGLQDTQQRIDVSRALYAYILNHQANAAAIETTIDEPQFGRTTKVLTLDGIDVIRYSEYPEMGHATGVPYSDTALYSWIMTRAIGVPNHNFPPSMVTLGNKSIEAGEALQFQVSATDPNDDPLTYSATGDNL